MIRYNPQYAKAGKKEKCTCATAKEATHPQHAKHLIPHRGDFRCPHWDWATDEAYRAELQEKQKRREQKRRSSRPRLVVPIAA